MGVGSGKSTLVVAEVTSLERMHEKQVPRTRWYHCWWWEIGKYITAAKRYINLEYYINLDGGFWSLCARDEVAVSWTCGGLSGTDSGKFGEVTLSSAWACTGWGNLG